MKAHQKNKHLQRFLSLLISLCVVLCFDVPLANATQSQGVTQSKTPVPADGVRVKWAKRLATGYQNAPGVPVLADDCLLLMCGDILYKLNRENGQEISHVQMAQRQSFAYTTPLCHDGVIYCPLENGTVQAFCIATLTSLWIYRDCSGGQALSPIAYDDGCIYTGFWNGETEPASFVCLNAADEIPGCPNEEKTALWTYSNVGGYYWAGCAFNKATVFVGTDDGTYYDNQPSRLLALNKKTGKLTDYVTVTGDVRSGICQWGQYLYFVTKAGYLYRVTADKGGFNKQETECLSLGGAATATPVIYQNRLYVGIQGKTPIQGWLTVADATQMRILYIASVKGYPQNAVLISNAYEQKTGKLYIYTTYNAPPGGITVFTESQAGLSLVAEDLFIPSKSGANYCISPIIADNDGNLYYKNDSGYVFCLQSKRVKSTNPLVTVYDAVADLIKELLKKAYGIWI